MVIRLKHWLRLKPRFRLKPWFRLKPRFQAAVLGLVVVVLVACQDSPRSPTPTLVSTKSLTATFTQKPTERPATPTGTSTAVPPTRTPVPSHTVTPTPTDVPADAPAYLPRGFYTETRKNLSVSLSLFKSNGTLLAEITLPGLYQGTPAYVHFGGGQSAGEKLPFIYFSEENRGELRVLTHGVMSILRAVPNFLSMAGTPGQPVLAYTLRDLTYNTYTSQMYVGTLKSISTAPAMLSIVDPESCVLKVLSLRAEDDQPTGVWYTVVTLDVGGDVVFEPRKGLKYLDLTTAQITSILDRTANPSSLSFDQTWVAYSFLGGPLTVGNLLTYESVTIPPLTESDRGAGNAFFAPDNRYVAWMEGSGWRMTEIPSYHTTIRVAALDGTVVANIPQSAFEGVAGPEAILWLEPVGWLNEKTLIVQVRLGEWDHAALIRVAYDGSQIAFLAPGAFAGFMYP